MIFILYVFMSLHVSSLTFVACVFCSLIVFPTLAMWSLSLSHVFWMLDPWCRASLQENESHKGMGMGQKERLRG